MQKSASQSKMGNAPGEPLSQSFDDNAMQMKEQQMKGQLIEELRKKVGDLHEETQLLKQEVDQQDWRF